MVALRRFNESGIDRFDGLIRSAQQGEAIDLAALLEDPSCVDPLPEGLAVDVDPFALNPGVSRRNAAEYLLAILEPVEQIRGYLVSRDRGRWAWMSAFWLPALAVEGDGTLRIRHSERYVPVADWRKYYRHLLLGPYLVGRAFGDNLDLAMSLLATPVSQPGELVAQLGASRELASNRVVVGAATALYYDPVERRLRTGCAAKGPGTARRLTALLNQLNLTWDPDIMDRDGLLDLLPKEFDRFR